MFWFKLPNGNMVNLAFARKIFIRSLKADSLGALAAFGEKESDCVVLLTATGTPDEAFRKCDQFIWSLTKHTKVLHAVDGEAEVL